MNESNVCTSAEPDLKFSIARFAPQIISAVRTSSAVEDESVDDLTTLVIQPIFFIIAAYNWRSLNGMLVM